MKGEYAIFQIHNWVPQINSTQLNWPMYKPVGREEYPTCQPGGGKYILPVNLEERKCILPVNLEEGKPVSMLPLKSVAQKAT